MAIWTDENGLKTIRYDGHMCIHEQLHRSREIGNSIIDSQTWLDFNLPSCQHVVVEVSYFNIFMIPSHVDFIINDYPNIEKITINRTANNWMRPEYGLLAARKNNSFIANYYDNSDIHFLDRMADSIDIVVLDDSLRNLQHMHLTNHHTLLILDYIKNNIFWDATLLYEYFDVTKNTPAHNYKNWFMPLHMSNKNISWDSFKRMIGERRFFNDRDIAYLEYYDMVNPPILD